MAFDGRPIAAGAAFRARGIDFDNKAARVARRLATILALDGEYRLRSIAPDDVLSRKPLIAAGEDPLHRVHGRAGAAKRRNFSARSIVSR